MVTPYLNLTRRDLKTAAEDIANKKDSRVHLFDDPPTDNRCARCNREKWPSLQRYCAGCNLILNDAGTLIAETY